MKGRDRRVFATEGAVLLRIELVTEPVEVQRASFLQVDPMLTIDRTSALLGRKFYVYLGKFQYLKTD